MPVKFRHFISATEDHSVTVAWAVDHIALPKEKESFSPHFVIDIGLAFQRRKPYRVAKRVVRTSEDGSNVLQDNVIYRWKRDTFSKVEGRNKALERLQNNYMQIRLYPDETIDHSIYREIRKLSPEQASSLKIPQKFYSEMQKTLETPIPLHNVDFDIDTGTFSVTHND